MVEADLSDKFIAFEKNENLFKLKDENNICIWDIVRFDIYVNLMWDYKEVPPIKRGHITLLNHAISKFWSLLTYWINNKQYENFFFLCSRNTIKEKFFDQNSYSVVNHFSVNSCYFFESNNLVEKDLLLNKSVYNFPQLLHRKFYKLESTFDFSIIVDKVAKEFGYCPLNHAALSRLITSFYSDRDFFKKLFKKKKIKRIFVTQNGIQKGLFAAARELRLSSYEFQHGIVDKGHLAYNYPDIELNVGQVYLPNIIFSLSDFWFKSLHLPNVSVRPLGNDFFSKEITPLKTDIRSIVVVSADVFGAALEKFIVANANLTELIGRKIFFKLHPNQFWEKEYYQSRFIGFSNVEVISNEYSVAELLERSETLLTIQSTAVYEALQAGRKVLLLKESTYKRHADLFSNANLYLIDDAKGLKNALNANITKADKITFFSPYNPQILQESLTDQA